MSFNESYILIQNTPQQDIFFPIDEILYSLAFHFSDLFNNFIFEAMNLLQLILFTLFVFTTNAQWYIKKTEHTKHMNYPNPGKRSLSDEEMNFVENDCSKPYSHFQSSREKIAWIVKCIYTKSSLEKTDENFFSSNSNSNEGETTLIPIYNRRADRSSRVTPFYYAESNKAFNNYLLKVLQGKINNT